MVDGQRLWLGARTVVTRLAKMGCDDGKTQVTKHPGVLRCCLPYAGPLHAHGRSRKRRAACLSFRECFPHRAEAVAIQVVVLETLSPDSMLADLCDAADDE